MNAGDSITVDRWISYKQNGVNEYISCNELYPREYLLSENAFARGVPLPTFLIMMDSKEKKILRREEATLRDRVTSLSQRVSTLREIVTFKKVPDPKLFEGLLLTITSLFIVTISGLFLFTTSIYANVAAAEEIDLPLLFVERPQPPSVIPPVTFFTSAIVAIGLASTIAIIHIGGKRVEYEQIKDINAHRIKRITDKVDEIDQEILKLTDRLSPTSALLAAPVPGSTVSFKFNHTIQDYQPGVLSCEIQMINALRQYLISNCDAWIDQHQKPEGFDTFTHVLNQPQNNPIQSAPVLNQSQNNPILSAPVKKKRRRR